MRWVRKAAGDAGVVERGARRPFDAADEHRERRRELLRRGLALAASAAMPLPAFGRAAAPRVVVVGGGLAGLAAAYALANDGLAATVFEAAPRVGGRCWTERRAFDGGQIAERGGELIDTAHDEIIDLALGLGLPLDDLSIATPATHESVFLDGGARYALHEATADFRQIIPALRTDAKTLAPALPTHRRATAAQRALDRLSAAQWIDSRVPGGRGSRLGRLLVNAYTEELGADPDEISAVTVVSLIAGSPDDRFSPYEESDQRYHVRGGNDGIVQRLAASLGDRIVTGARLVALAHRPDGRVALTFARDAAQRVEIADRVVLAMPFTLLRDVDLSRARIGQLKRRAIAELGMGRNTKLQLQFDGRPWLDVKANGETRLVDAGPYQVSWEVSRAQAGVHGILNFFSGGAAAVRAGDGEPEARAREALAAIERAHPGLAARWNGRVIRNAWDRYPWSRGSYSLLMPGQYTAFHGIEHVAEGNVHFAGEQSSDAWSGYLNGAVESGQRAAREIVRATRASARAA